jgi:hypothetical protein
MKRNCLRTFNTYRLVRYVVAIFCSVLLVPGNLPLSASQEQQQAAEQSVKVPPEQLDSLVAPIALYPDNLLGQTLVASTYPLELIQLQQWLQQNPGLKDKALVDAVSKQPWDPSIQAMAALPDVVKRLADNIQWTTDLGNAFLAQQGAVMDAVQRMRTKAQKDGALESNKEQIVETKVEGSKSVVVIEQADPQVVYVPSYNPVAVYGEPIYPYPAMAYPAYSTGAAIAASAISFGTGIAMGAAWGGGWGWGVGWGHNDIDINRNNNFNRNTNVNANRSARGTWQHNPQHRGGAPYSDRATANRYGSNARGDSLASRQKGAQQQIARQKGNLGSTANRSAGAGRTGTANLGGAGAGARSRSGVGAGAAGRATAAGADRVGSRNLGSSRSAGSRGGFGGGSGGFSGSSARASSARGSSSMGSRGGGSRGGGSRGGGGRGGGGRGGGGRGGGRR